MLLTKKAIKVILRKRSRKSQLGPWRNKQHNRINKRRSMTCWTFLSKIMFLTSPKIPRSKICWLNLKIKSRTWSKIKIGSKKKRKEWKRIGRPRKNKVMMTINTLILQVDSHRVNQLPAKKLKVLMIWFRKNRGVESKKERAAGLG